MCVHVVVEHLNGLSSFAGHGNEELLKRSEKCYCNWSNIIVGLFVTSSYCYIDFICN